MMLILGNFQAPKTGDFSVDDDTLVPSLPTGQGQTAGEQGRRIACQLAHLCVDVSLQFFVPIFSARE